jgi:hypothetical protein
VQVKRERSVLGSIEILGWIVVESHPGFIGGVNAADGGASGGDIFE